MKIIITGGNGFVGEQLILSLIKENHEIVLLQRKQYKLNLGNKVKFVSLLNANWKTKVNEFRPEIIIHLASFLTSSDDESIITELISANLLFGTELLNTIDTNSIKLFINTGSFSEYDKSTNLSPSYLYSATKTAFRSILKYYQNKNNFKVINVIPYTIYGKKDTRKKVIDYIYDSSSGKELVKMSPGEQVLDFIHINDIVQFYLCALNNFHFIHANWEDVHLGTGIGTTPRKIELLFNELGIQTRIEWGGLQYRKNDTMYTVAPYSKLMDQLNWRPEIDIQNGIRLYINEKNNNNGI